MRRQLPLINCVQCGREFAPIRVDARFCCRACLERHFVEERRGAVAAYRQQQRMERASLFFSGTQLPRADDDEDNQTRRAVR
jgi:hypothetical protein